MSTLITNASLTNSNGSTWQQLSENDNSNLRTTGITSITQRTSVLPPPYCDVVQKNLITITMEQHCSEPPSYDDFVRGNNVRE